MGQTGNLLALRIKSNILGSSEGRRKKRASPGEARAIALGQRSLYLKQASVFSPWRNSRELMAQTKEKYNEGFDCSGLQEGEGSKVHQPRAT